MDEMMLFYVRVELKERCSGFFLYTNSCFFPGSVSVFWGVFRCFPVFYFLCPSLPLSSFLLLKYLVLVSISSNCSTRVSAGLWRGEKAVSESESSCSVLQYRGY